MDNRIFENDIGICHYASQIYQFQPGVHEWYQIGLKFRIYNINNTLIPDGNYTFFRQLFQNPKLVYNAYMIVANHTLTNKFDTRLDN